MQMGGYSNSEDRGEPGRPEGTGPGGRIQDVLAGDPHLKAQDKLAFGEGEGNVFPTSPGLSFPRMKTLLIALDLNKLPGGREGVLLTKSKALRVSAIQFWRIREGSGWIGTNILARAPPLILFP